jgi:hypothetical protein
LLDNLIRYSLRREMPLDQAVGHLVELAKQRLPEYRLQSSQVLTELALVEQIKKSGARSIVMRVPIRSWVHEVHWAYYPEFHVIATPIEYYAFPVRDVNIKNWPAVCEPTVILLDDLFFDPDDESFWQPEPFLAGLPASDLLYKHIASDKLEPLSGTEFLKVRPDLIMDVVKTRSGLPNYSVRKCDSEDIFGLRPYGSKGWKLRLAGVDRHWSRRRKTEWRRK